MAKPSERIVHIAQGTKKPKVKKPDILMFFEYKHLPKELQKVSKPFSKLAHKLWDVRAPNPFLKECLYKLLEAKDCAVRADLFANRAEEYMQQQTAKKGSLQDKLKT